MKDASPLRCVAPLLVAFALAACGGDGLGVGLQLHVSDAAISTEALGAVDLVPGQATERTVTITPGVDFTAVDDLQSLKLRPAAVQFDARPGAGPASGTVYIQLARSGKPFLGVTVTIVNNVVTAVDPSVATAQQMVERIKAQVQTATAAVSESAPLLGSVENLTAAEIVAAVNGLAAPPSSPLTIVVVPLSGNLDGSLRLREFSIDATVRK
jgi:hypothetical protein